MLSHSNHLFNAIILGRICGCVCVHETKLIHSLFHCPALMKWKVVHHQQDIIEWISSSQLIKETFELHCIDRSWMSLYEFQSILSWYCKDDCYRCHVGLTFVKWFICSWQCPNMSRHGGLSAHTLVQHYDLSSLFDC